MMVNRRYCYCNKPKPNTALVPKCETCGYYIVFGGKQLYSVAFYRKQIKGLILILDDAEPMITTEYVKEKLQMIMNGGIGFHQTILNHLEEKEKIICQECNGTGKHKRDNEYVPCGLCGGSGLDDGDVDE
jgi:Zn finger protein HypA/HybF involved in hydrogenase expression